MFDRDRLQKIREEALAESRVLCGNYYHQTLIDLAIAADKLDALIGRREKITIDKFRNLVPVDSPDRNQLYGAIALETKKQKKMCENLKVGDVVWYFMVMPKLDDPNDVTEIALTEADVVE